jgi:ribosomal protein S18 acetylase RimI-like enzyme
MSDWNRPEHIRRILGHNPIWSAYALVDLEPGYFEDTTWHVNQTSVILIYAGLTPPVLFAEGPPQDLRELFQAIPAARYQFSFMQPTRDLVHSQMKIEFEFEMLRMVFDPDPYDPPAWDETFKISRIHQEEIEALFDGQVDQPDAFHLNQLDEGTFFGVRRKRKLVSISGTHVVSQNAGIAAIGNVYTQPAWRKEGLATTATAAVLAELCQRGIKTIVLNVARKNKTAISVYRRLGFKPFCGYYEGVAEFTP